MPPDLITVTLGVGAAPYQKTLACSLLRAGILRRLFDFSPWFDVHVQEPNANGSLEQIKRFPAYKFANRAAWAIWRRLPEPVRPRPPVALNVSLADRLLTNWIVPSTIFHGCTACCLASLRVAKKLGSITLVENAARHPRHWKETEVEESRRFGVRSRTGSGHLPAFLMDRREREFEWCDWIVVPSNIARQSFYDLGYGEKTKVVLTGVDADLFTPKHEPAERSLFRVLYVGRVELSKGLAYLLQAWKRLALSDAELTLVGSVNPHMQSLLKTYADPTVRVMGFLPQSEVLRCYQTSDLFAFPSPNEGLAQVLLEAMASGLPTVASDHSGADDVITDGKEGFIVPVRDVDRLAEAILWGYQHRDELRAMGQAARARIESNFTLEHYNQRMIAVYREVAGSGREDR
jgi:glycosyltransferase involved in cell wall biosynthesis